MVLINIFYFALYIYFNARIGSLRNSHSLQTMLHIIFSFQRNICATIWNIIKHAKRQSANLNLNWRGKKIWETFPYVFSSLRSWNVPKVETNSTFRTICKFKASVAPRGVSCTENACSSWSLFVICMASCTKHGL